MRLLATLALACALLSASSGDARAAPECGVGAQAPWESLCNVDGTLRPSYLWLERVDLRGFDGFRDRISGMVRDKKVTVEWSREVPPGILGAWHSQTRRVLIPAQLQGQPDRVEAAILAHELWHSYNHLTGTHRPFTIASCLADEREAYMVGQLFYAGVFSLTGENTITSSPLDRTFLLDALAWIRSRTPAETLAAMAERHVRDNNYAAVCARMVGRS